MTDLTHETDEWLQSARQYHENQIAAHRESIKHLSEELKSIQAEIDKRRVEAFWAIRPDLQLRIGDKLTPNKQFFEVGGIKPDMYEKEWYSVNGLLYVIEIRLGSEKPFKVCFTPDPEPGELIVWITFDSAIQMRLAYLNSQVAK